MLPLVEMALRHGDNLTFDIGKLILSSHGKSDPLAFEVHDIKLLGPRGEFLTIGRADLGLSPYRLLIGQIHFSYAIVQNLSLRIIRLPGGTVTMTGAETAAQGTRSAEVDLSTLIHDLPAIDKLTLPDMRVIFEDQKDALIRRFDDVDLEINQSGGFGRRSVSGYLTMSLTGAKGESMSAFDFIYDAADKTLTAEASLENAGTRELIGGFLHAANLPMIDMKVRGRAQVRIKNDFTLDSLKFHLQGDDGTLYWPRNYGAGLENQKLRQFDLNVGYAPETQTLELINATINIKGILISAQGKLSADAGWDTLAGDVQLNIPVVAVDALPAVWPKVWDSGGRGWLVDKMDKGRFSKIDVNVPITAKHLLVVPNEDEMEIAAQEGVEPEEDYEWDVQTGNIKGTFEFTGVTVDYRKPMLAAKNTTGHGSYEGLALTLDIDKALIGGLNVTNGSLYFDDLITPGKGMAYLHFVMNGPVASVFDYLDREPISYRKKVSLDASNAKGRADLDVKVEFPTLHDMKVADVHVNIDAKLYDLFVPGAVKGLSLAGGPYHLEASENHFKISGAGAIEGQPAKLTWQEVFDPKPSDAFSSSLEADIQSNKAIREKFLGALEARIEGIIPATVSLVTKPNGHGDLKASADLTGARIDFTDPFNTVKEKGVGASVKVTGTLQDNNIQSIDTLSASGPGVTIASGNVIFARDAKNEPILSKVNLKGLKLGENDADLDVVWPSEHDLRANVSGAAFDARWIMAPPIDPSKKIATGYDINLKLGRLFLADRPLQNVTGTFIGNTGGIIKRADLDGMAEAAPVTLHYSATGGGDRLLMEMADAGTGLSAFGITDRVRGGHLLVQGAPMEKGQSGDMEGKLVLERFSVHNAPVLAKLINLLSVPGLLNILTQDTGLKFERAESKMTWLNRNGGGLLHFKDGRTSGSSLGLTFEGDIDTGSDQMAIQGTVIPMSEVNSLISSIPLVGDILTGGAKGSGIFAATYKVRGPTTDPEVSINPLSVLAPGILRRILFEGALSGGSNGKPLTGSETPAQ